MKKIFGVPMNVVNLGLVSLFNDVASEMIYPIVPIFLTSVLGAPKSVVGLIEGIAEATASLLKIFSGWISDRLEKRKPFVTLGYSTAVISKIIMAFSYVWPWVLFARFIDRFGKGVRTSARDALIAESTDKDNLGKAFGLHRAMDTLGAVAGPLLALVLIKYFHDDYRTIFLIASVPAVIGVGWLILAVTEAPKQSAGTSAGKLPINLKTAREVISRNKAFGLFLIVSLVFSLGNSSDAFLILRAQNLGLSVMMTILAYVLYNTTYSLFSYLAGDLSDRIGPKNILIGGFLFYALVYGLFGWATGSWIIWFLFPIYGLYMAMTDGVGKAYIANLVPSEYSGTAFGVYQTAVGFAAFFASLIAGLLWDSVGVSAPFYFGAALAFVAACLFLFSDISKTKTN